MSAYLIATMTILDPAKANLYRETTAGLSGKFGGEPVIKGPVRACLEGQTLPDERVVVLRFPDEASVRNYISCPEYVQARAIREDAVRQTLRLVVD